MKTLRRWLPALLVGVFVLDTILMLVNQRAPGVERVIMPGDVIAREGHAFLINVGPLVRWPYEVPGGMQSTLQLIHDGAAQGPAHAPPEDIRKVGNGAYSHRGNTLYLSVPGNGELAPVTLRATSRLSSSMVILASIVTLTVLCACCMTWYQRLFATPQAQARTYRSVGVVLCFGLLIFFLLGWMKSAPLVIFSPDTPGYLRPALVASQGGDLAIMDRTLGYPAFLAAVLLFTGSLAQIPTAQFVLVIGTVLGTIALLWVASRVRVGGSLGLSLFQALLTVITVAMLLAYQPLTSYVHHIMPEVLYALLAVLVLLVLVAAYQEVNSVNLFGLYLIGTLLSTFTYYVKPHWGAALAFTWIALTLRLFLRVGNQQTLRLALAAAAPVAAGTIALFLLFLPQKTLNDRYGGGRYALFGPLTLFCTNANLVEPVIDKVNIPRDLADRLSKSLRETLEVNPGPYRKLLGFDADYCFYRSKLRDDLNAHFGKDISSQRDLLMRSFFAGVLQQPIGYAWKVGHQITYALSHPVPHINVRGWSSSETYRMFVREGEMAPFKLPEEWITGLAPRPLLATFPLSEHLATSLLALLNRLAILVWAGILGGACVAAVRWRRGSSVCGQALVTMGLAVGLYLSSTVVVALAHSFDFVRYLEGIAPLALVTMAMCILQLSSALLAGEPEVCDRSGLRAERISYAHHGLPRGHAV
jgi:hypothetical protein